MIKLLALYFVFGVVLRSAGFVFRLDWFARRLISLNKSPMPKGPSGSIGVLNDGIKDFFLRLLQHLGYDSYVVL